MKKLFEMGAKFDDDWHIDNRQKPKNTSSTEAKVPEKHQLHFSKEKRRGKTVTLVKPFYLSKKDMQALLKILKKKLGTGGTLKKDTLEFQGEVEEKLRIQLEILHYRLKK